jgi:hypothetical protein
MGGELGISKVSLSQSQYNLRNVALTTDPQIEPIGIAVS